MTKIIIAGIGGVGGYFGGLLAKQFYNNNNVEINFLARGLHLNEIKKNGLTVIKGAESFVAKPNIITDNASEIGIADFIIICTKSYDLEPLLEQLKPCINHQTILLSLLNGVDSCEKIKKVFPNNIAVEGCVYIVSRLKQVGIVENSGNIQLLYFGLNNNTSEQLVFLKKLFVEAGIEATLFENIAPIIWEKFIFLSPIATITSYYNKNIGEILSNKESLLNINKLINEITSIANAKNIGVSSEIVEKTMIKLSKLPFETTTSMHMDYKNHKAKTEIESLTNFVITEGIAHNIPTPTYEMMYKKLLEKAKHNNNQQ